MLSDNPFYINVAELPRMLPRPARKYCKKILHEDDVEISQTMAG